MSCVKQTKIVRKVGGKSSLPKAERSVSGTALAQTGSESGAKRAPVRPPRRCQRPVDEIRRQETGNVLVDRLFDGTGFTKKNLAGTLGVSMDAMYRADRVNSPTTQVRMREMLEILGRITAWAGGEVQAMAWYRGQPIPAFGGRTAESLVKSNQAGPTGSRQVGKGGCRAPTASRKALSRWRLPGCVLSWLG